jgi:hypothetical protein
MFRDNVSVSFSRVECKTILLLKKSSLAEEVCKWLCPVGSRPPRLYGIPKIHKEGVPLRPILSNIGAPTYQLSKYLAGILSPFVGCSMHHVKISIEFAHTLGTLQVRPEDLMVSFDVVSLFTWVPMVESLNLLSQHFSEDLQALFRHVLTSTYFSFGGQFYEQTDDLAVGCPLSPVTSNFFMDDLKERALKQVTHKLLCWFCYVDNTFVTWPHGPEKLERFLDHLNGLHRNIQITMDTEKGGHLPFLDIDIYRRPDGSLGHKVYRTPTYTNLYLNPGSHHHPSNKQAVLATLVHRVRALCDKKSLHGELEFLKTTLKENG